MNVAPEQIGDGVKELLKLGIGLTLTVAFAVAVMPFASVTVTVYNVVAVGDAVGFDTDVAVKPAAGAHE